MRLDAWWGDARYAWRNVVRRPGSAALVVTTLALGIGINSAVFALVDSALLRPLPYRDPSRLVFVWQTLPEHNISELEPTAFDYDAWHAVRSFSQIALVANGAFTLTGDDNPERVRGARVTASLMPLLGVTPRIGRAFTPSEDTDAAPPVAILSDGLWRRRYGSDPAVLGRILNVDGTPRTIVGVMPPRVSLPGPLAGDDDVWLSTQMSATERANAISHNYTILARLNDETTLTRASAELEGLASRISAEHPSSHRAIGVRIVPAAEQTAHAIRPTLVIVAGGVALLLLVACANASTLLIARASNRRQELAVRTALGATRSRLLSLAVTECLVLALLGGVAGLVLGRWTLQGLMPLFAGMLPASETVDIDGRAALFTAGITVLLALVFGVVVAAHRPESRLVDSLSSSARTASGRASRSRGVLVVAQVALAVVLLCAAGLMLNSVVRLSRVSPGFDADRVLTLRVALTGANYAAAPKRVAFAGDLLERLTTTPGIRSAALTSAIPFGGTRGANGVEIEGRAKVTGQVLIVDQRYVSPGYFQTMGIPVLRGRLFTAHDDAQAERVTIINRAMADRYWPNASPIDRRVRLSAGFDSASWFRIVGVVDNVRHISLSREPVDEMYHPYAQTAVPTFAVVAKTVGEPGAVAPVIRASVQTVDPNLPVYDVRPMADRIAGSFAQTRGTMLLLLVTAMLAAALAGVAIYGSIWFSVSQRIREIGIRLALGATRASICADVLRKAVWLTCIGMALGMAGSVAAGRLMTGLLFETKTSDPATYAEVVLALLALTTAAALAPARRAMRVDPMTALRTD
jgi:putative ABC transport system permease protein